jgi:hypothetical protein
MNKYPTISKVVSTPENVEISMEHVIDDEPNYQKIPLTIHVVPHDGKFFLHFSGMANTRVEIVRTSANGMYIEFVK